MARFCVSVSMVRSPSPCATTMVTMTASATGMTPDKPSVTIIGLLPRQAERVKSEYGSEVDLQFVRVDDSMPKIKATAESSDHVILMTKFMPHSIQAALRGHEGLVYCNGGTSSVGAKLDELLSL